MKKIVKLTISLTVVIILTIGLSIPIGDLPAVGNILNPYDGVYETARLANKPAQAEISSSQISNKVTVLRDDFEVPHVFAETDEEMYYTLGYLHAQDRLFQMDMQRRAAKGELAEIIGEGQVDSDIEMRKMGLKHAAEYTLEKFENSAYMNYLEAYCAGVNKRIKEGKLPLEYKLLNTEPEKWTPIDTFAVSKLISWGLSGTKKPIEYGKLQGAIGKDNWRELFPEENPYSVRIHDPPYPYAENTNNSSNTSPGQEKATEYLNKIEEGLSLDSKSRAGLGSNNWAVAGENSETNGPILASDPHLNLPMPPLWYQAYLKTEDGFNTRGVTLPGIPVVLIGTNESIAWGMTNVTASDTDFYEYETTEDGEEYLYDNEWVEFEEREETIEVSGSEDVQITIKETVHGPIVETIDDKPIAMKWTGHNTWTDLKGMLRINKADNLEEFKSGLQHWECPPQNFAYADKHGNIGMFTVGKIPIREDENYIPGILDGSDPKNEWDGYIPFEELPHTVNPDKGYVSSANQDPVTKEYPYQIGRKFRPGYRGRRIDNLLSSKGSHSITDFKNYQGDIVSVAAKEMLPIFFDVVSNEELEGLESEIVQVLKDWNYEMDKDKTAPVAWTIWEMTYFRTIFDDFYRKKGVQDLTMPDPLVGEILTKDKPNSVWFDNLYTEERENRADVVLKSLSKTAYLLKEELGDDINEWEWGDVNKYYFEHHTGLEPFSFGPVSASGGRVTLNVAPETPPHPDLDEMVAEDNLEFSVSHAPSWRMIVTPGEEQLGVLPGGQSGNPLSEHYTDQLEKYLKLEYGELVLPESPDKMSENLVKNRLVVKPKGGS